MKNIRLQFNQLSAELDVIEREDLIAIKGGVDETSSTPVTDWISQMLGVTVISGYDEEGFWAIKTSMEGNWIRVNFSLQEVEIVGYGTYSKPPQFDYNDNPFAPGWTSTETSGGGGGIGSSSFDWSNAFDWNAVFGNLENYSGLAELGAYGAQNLKAAEAFSRLGIFASVGGIVLNSIELKNYYQNGQGNMDGVRFGITTGSAAFGMASAALAGGGPYGVLIGGLTIGASWSFEQMYDVVQNWIGRVSQGSADFSTAISNGWAPGYHN